MLRNGRTKTMRTATSFAMLLLLAITFSVGSAQAAADTDTETRLKHSRTFESIIWSVPLMNYKATKDGLKNGGGINYGDVAYHSKIGSIRVSQRKNSCCWAAWKVSTHVAPAQCGQAVG